MKYARWTAFAVLALALVGCASQGPGMTDPCTQAEANPAGVGSQAAAAAARGGQTANQAPFAEDTVSPNAKTTIARGQGSSRSASSDQDTKHVVSGGAQNCGVVLPNTANASNSGGSNPAVLEAAKTATATRNAWLCAATDPTVPQEKIMSLHKAMTEAQAALSLAQNASAVSHITNNNFQNSRVNQFPVSSSSSAGRPDPTIMGPIAKAASEVGTAVFSDEIYEAAAPTEPDSPPDGLGEPPAGDVVVPE